MANEIYIIRTSTLRAIADSIRTVRGITAEIPTSELASALRTGAVATTAEPTTLSELLIRKQTLVDIADVIREQTGDTAEISVNDLSATILHVFADIPELVITDGEAIYVENSGGGLTLYVDTLPAPSIYREVEETPKLAAPSIYREVEETPKLAAPSIYREVEETPKLAAPSVYLETVA